MKKYSRQREEIQQAVEKNLIHPTANDVYIIVKQVDPQISLGTVYRNLNYLVEQKSIQKISMPGSSDRFDGNPKEHYHVICKNCDAIFDLDFDSLHSLNEKIREATGVHVTGYHLIVYGICQNCQNIK
jgi:Fur family peroxide stress response transcriptional regulator